jgi:hypothetical protein
MPERRAFGIHAATITRDSHDFRMLAELFGEAVGGLDREERQPRGGRPDWPESYPTRANAHPTVAG